MKHKSNRPESRSEKPAEVETPVGSGAEPELTLPPVETPEPEAPETPEPEVSATEPEAPAPATGSAPEAADIEERIHQAYLRGRNETIEALMQRPGMLQPVDTLPHPLPEEPEVMILNNPRPSIWDR